MINAKMEIYEGVLGDLPPPATQRFPKEEMQLLFMASCALTLLQNMSTVLWSRMNFLAPKCKPVHKFPLRTGH
jgi:hypothetical protein